MYYGRKAEPQASKITRKRDLDRSYALHRRRLANIKPSIDNKPPRQPRHLKFNAKKEQMMEERYSKIEHENRILLQKMSEIMQKNTLDNYSNEYRYGHSLNRVSRKKELYKINQENQQLLRRIQGAMPVYNHYEWERDREEQEKMIENMCEYSPSITRRHAGSQRTLGLGRSRSSLGNRSAPTLAGAGASLTSHYASSTASLPKYSEGGENSMMEPSAGSSMAPPQTGTYGWNTGTTYPNEDGQQ